MEEERMRLKSGRETGRESKKSRSYKGSTTSSQKRELEKEKMVKLKTLEEEEAKLVEVHHKEQMEIDRLIKESEFRQKAGMKKIELEKKYLTQEHSIASSSRSNRSEQRSERLGGGDNMFTRNLEGKTKEWVEENFQREAKNPEIKSVTFEDLKYLMARKSSNHELPVFDGNPSQWPLFKTMFDKSTVSGKYTEDENLLRLQKALKGEARECLGSLLYLPGGLQRILVRLERKYGRPELIVKEVMQKLNTLPPMTENSLKGIDRLASEVDNAVNTVCLVNRPEYLKNPILLDTLVKKLNLTLKLQWGDYAARFCGNLIDIQQFNDWLQEKVEAIWFITDRETTEEPPEKQPTQEWRSTDKTSLYQGSFRRNCRLCQSKEHSQLEECQVFNKMDSNERYDYASTNGLCFLCLERGHLSTMCHSKTSCRMCKGGHHQLLHPKKVTGNIENLATHHDNHDEQELGYDESEISATTLTKKSKVLVRVVPIKLIGPKKTVETYAFFDNGSTVTMLENGLAEELGLCGNEKPLRVKWTNGSMREDPDSREVNVKISGCIAGSKVYDVHNARTVRKLCLPVQTVNMEGLAQRWAHLKDIEAISYQHGKPRILIGEDNWPLTIPLKVVCGSWKGPVASKTRLGWVVHGNVQGIGDNTEKNHQAVHWEMNGELTTNEATEGSRNTFELTRNKIEDKQNKQGPEQTIQKKRKTHEDYEQKKRRNIVVWGKVEQSNNASNDITSFNKREREGEDEELQIEEKRKENNKRRLVKLRRKEIEIEEWMTLEYKQIKEVTLPVLKQKNEVPAENWDHAETHRRKEDIASSERKKRRRDVSLWSKNERHRKLQQTGTEIWYLLI